MSTPISEGLIALLGLLTVVAILGLAWLVYLGKGGEPFAISIKGLGLSVYVRPSQKEQDKDV